GRAAGETRGRRGRGRGGGWAAGRGPKTRGGVWVSMGRGGVWGGARPRGLPPLPRRSTAPVSQVVQPRFDPPATTKCLIATRPPSAEARNAVAASIALTALLTIGSRATQVASPVSRNLTSQ